MTSFEKPIENTNSGNTPPPISFDDIDFDAITKEALANRPFGGPQKSAEIHDFSDANISQSDKKALDREKQIAALRQDIAGM